MDASAGDSRPGTLLAERAEGVHAEDSPEVGGVEICSGIELSLQEFG